MVDGTKACRVDRVAVRLLAALVVATLGSGCACERTDEEILRERIDTTSVHLYLASKVGLIKADQSPEARKARDDLVKIYQKLKDTGVIKVGARAPGKEREAVMGDAHKPAPSPAGVAVSAAAGTAVSAAAGTAVSAAAGTAVSAAAGTAVSAAAGTAVSAAAGTAVGPVPREPQLSVADLWTLAKLAYSLKGEGKALLESGNEKGLKPVLPLLFNPKPELAKFIDINTEHAMLLTGMFLLKFNQKSPVPVPDELVLYEAWMTDPEKVLLPGFGSLIRAEKAIIYGGNELCDLAKAEADVLEKYKDLLDAVGLSAGFSAVRGESVAMLAEHISMLNSGVRALAHASTAVCYLTRDEDDDAELAIDELDQFVQAVHEMGVPARETAMIRAYIAIRRKERNKAKLALEEALADPTLDADSKADIAGLVKHLDDEAFYAGYFDRLFFLKITTGIVLREADRAGVFDDLKDTELVRSVASFVAGSSAMVSKAQNATSLGELERQAGDVGAGAGTRVKELGGKARGVLDRWLGD